MRKYPAKIFYCYSHRDEELRDRLEVHLKMLERQQFITNWHDRRIIPGQDWENKISEKLESSDIVLLLISPDFIASDYCYDIEMKRALKLHRENKVQIIPVVLRICDWKNSPFSKYQGLPTDMTPIMDSSWNSIDDALQNVAEGLKDSIRELFDSYPDPESNQGDISVLVDTKTVDVEITINQDYNSFSNDEQKIIIDSIQNFLKINRKLTIKTKTKGSIKLRFELSYENAIKLKYAVEDKLFENLNISNVEIFEEIFETEINESQFLEINFADLRRAVLDLRAINHKLRQRILILIFRNEPLTVRDIYIKLRLEQSVASQHLAILRRSGVVKTERKGDFIYYSLDRQRIKTLGKAIDIINNDV